MTEQPTCKMCKFFDVFVIKVAKGRCVRFPPQLPGFKDISDYHHHQEGIFPIVDEDDWCGEHKPKDGTTP